jgi:hypothetical protein
MHLSIEVKKVGIGNDVAVEWKRDDFDRGLIK